MTAESMNITEIVAQAYKAFDDAMDAGAMRSDAFHAAIALALKSAATCREWDPSREREANTPGTSFMMLVSRYGEAPTQEGYDEIYRRYLSDCDRAAERRVEALEVDLRKQARRLRAIVARRIKRIAELRMERDNADSKLREVERQLAEYTTNQAAGLASSNHADKERYDGIN